MHIPFCHSLCYYCGCNKIVTRNEERVTKYLQNLYREIDMQAELFDRSRKVEQLHFGGGTPTYLDEGQLRDLMGKLGEAFSFDTSAERQFSIEVDPRTVDADGIRLLTELGFNRLSLGIQDFNPEVQQAVNRIQSIEQTQGLVDAARESGFKSISFDLIYGLPLQTVESFDKTLLERTIERLTAAGYVYIGMDHFALPDDELVLAREEGTLQRNFQGYSTHRYCDLVSLGVSSISNIGNMYAQNAITTMEYEAILEGGHLPIKKGLIVDDDDLLRAQAIQALMCYDQLEFDAFDAAAGIEFREYFAEELAQLTPLEQDELVAVDDQAIRITPKGRLLLRNIAMKFDRYLRDSQHDDRYSRAI